MTGYSLQGLTKLVSWSLVFVVSASFLGLSWNHIWAIGRLFRRVGLALGV